ncbi:MAG: GGDEF domain-containing protein [Gammaproteobacteria bacterium]
MHYSQTIALRLTKQSSTVDLKNTFKNELESLSFIKKINVYEIFSLQKSLFDKNSLEIYDNMEEVSDPYWLEYWPENEYEITKPVRIKSNVISAEGQIDLYFLRGYEQTVKLIELHSKQASEIDAINIQYLIDIYKNQLELFNKFERDHLTGLYNRLTFDEKVMQLIQSNYVDESRMVEEDSHNWLAILDIDHFKKINDHYGHMYGDEILLLFADIMKNTFRFNDLLFRYGGEEFVVCLFRVKQEGAISAMERFRKAIENYIFPSGRRVTVSIGLAKVLDNELPTNLLDRADTSLYKAKDTGRNKLCISEIKESTNSESDEMVELF